MTVLGVGSTRSRDANRLRLLASMEGLTGILMCAWSGGFFFSVVTRVWERRSAALNHA